MQRSQSQKLARSIVIASAAIALMHSLPVRAHAQVNTETLRLGEPAEGLHGDLKADLALKRGNSEFFQLGSAGRTFYRAGVHTPLLFARGEIGTENDERFSENGFVHARWTAMWHPRFGSELFGQLHYDAFIDLKFRALIGAGPRFMVVDEASLELYLGTGYMLEHEVLSVPADEPHPRRTLHHRSTSYAALKLAVTEALALTNVAYFQPRWDRPRDYRVLEELELQADINDYLALVSSVVLRYDSDPPSTVVGYDLNLKLGVRLTSDRPL
jgi:putative salt-induced outer membrane protein YdiY